jgi:tight adherence protein C
MFLLALLALALAGITIAALFRVLTLSRTRIAAQLDDVSAYGYAPTAPTSPAEPARRDSALSSIAGRMGNLVAGRVGAAREGELRKLLMGAGMYSVSARTVLGYRFLAAMMLSGLGLLLGGNVLLRVAAAGLFAACGWVLPVMFVRRRAMHRALEIERGTPNLIDQIVVSLEAGVGFSAALRTAADRLGGPLGEEIRLVLQAQQMGSPLTESLQQLRARVASANLQSFVRAVVQGERMGVSIGQIMRDLAIDMRKRRRQMAEERAQKAPVKLLFPVVFLILPTIFIVVMVPPLLTILNGFLNHG